MIAGPPVRRMRGRARALAPVGQLGTICHRGCRSDAVGERAVLDPRGGMAQHEVAFGVGQVLGSGAGDIAGAHGPVDADL